MVVGAAPVELEQGELQRLEGCGDALGMGGRASWRKGKESGGGRGRWRKKRKGSRENGRLTGVGGEQARGAEGRELGTTAMTDVDGERRDWGKYRREWSGVSNRGRSEWGKDVFAKQIGRRFFAKTSRFPRCKNYDFAYCRSKNDRVRGAKVMNVHTVDEGPHWTTG
jgi:hypothetical protein